ncbi:hypothetical protein WJX74_010041 [Apatococcus lobatus]|uniref:Uncharacterized protein n=1 Tax=Apatococcus lobatus TaxID=904363 RepID=A0AAW1S255_9CHLO
MAWVLGSFSALQNAWAQKSGDQTATFSSNHAAQDLPRWDTVAFKQTLREFQSEAWAPTDTINQLQAISRVILQPKKPSPHKLGSAAWAASKPPEPLPAHKAEQPGSPAGAPHHSPLPFASATSSLLRPQHAALMPAAAAADLSALADAQSALTESQSTAWSILTDMVDMAVSHSQQQLQCLDSCSSSFDLRLQLVSSSPRHSVSSLQTSSSVPIRSRSSSDLQHGASCKGESASDRRDAKLQAAETSDELQRIREDRDQLRIALDSALSQTQQLGALQSEVSMLKGQLEETRQLTAQQMARTQSVVSLPGPEYDQGFSEDEMMEQPASGLLSGMRRHSTCLDRPASGQPSSSRPPTLPRRYSIDAMATDHRKALPAPDLPPLVESPMKTPSATPSMDLGQLSFADAQALLCSLDATLPALNGAGTSLTARAKHAAGAANDLEKAQSELRALRDLRAEPSCWQHSAPHAHAANSQHMRRSSSLPDVKSCTSNGSSSNSSPFASRPSSSSGLRHNSQQLRLDAVQLQARIDALEDQLSREQGRAFRASQERGRLAGELDNLRSAKSDRMGIQGRLSTMADTLAGTHKDLIGAMQQRNAFKHLLKSILDAVEHFVSAANDERQRLQPLLVQHLEDLQEICEDAQQHLQSVKQN